MVLQSLVVSRHKTTLRISMFIDSEIIHSIRVIYRLQIMDHREIQKTRDTLHSNLLLDRARLYSNSIPLAVRRKPLVKTISIGR